MRPPSHNKAVRKQDLAHLMRILGRAESETKGDVKTNDKLVFHLKSAIRILLDEDAGRGAAERKSA